MNCNFTRLLLATAISLFSAAGYSAVEHAGEPESKPKAVTTFGVDAPVKAAFKAVIPDGWQVMLHPAAKLAPRASWSGGQSWVDALGNLAKQSGLVAKVDWTKRTIFLRTPAVAAEERAPVPADVTALESKQDVPVRVSALATVSELPASEAASRLPPIEGTAKTFTGAHLSGVLEHLGRIHALTLSHSTSRDIPFPGPVTIKGADPSEDLRLVSQALGSTSPMSLEYYPLSRFVRVVPATAGSDRFVVLDRPYEGLVVTKGPEAAPSPTSTVPAPTLAGVVAQAASNLPSKASQAPVEAEKPSAGPEAASEAQQETAKFLTLNVPKGASLETEVRAFLTSQGFELLWQVPETLEANWPVVATGKSIAEVLGQVIPHLGLSADVIVPSKVVFVRPGDAALDR